MKNSRVFSVAIASVAALALVGCNRTVVETPTDIPVTDALAECLVSLYTFDQISTANAVDPSTVDQTEFTNAYLEVANYCEGIEAKTNDLVKTPEQTVCLAEIDRMSGLFRQLYDVRVGNVTGDQTARAAADALFPEVQCQNLAVLDDLAKVSK